MRGFGGGVSGVGVGVLIKGFGVVVVRMVFVSDGVLLVVVVDVIRVWNRVEVIISYILVLREIK